MNKEEFIKRLKDGIDILEPKLIELEALKYQEEIEKQYDAGKTEADIIKNFGTISELQAKIYKSHGINPDKIIKKNSFIYRQFEELFHVIHHVIDEMSKNDVRSNIKVIFDLLILLIFISLIKIPFIVIRNLGENLILYFDIQIFSDIWGILIDVIYIVIAITVFVNIFNKYFKNFKVQKKLKIKTKELESIKLEEKK